MSRARFISHIVGMVSTAKEAKPPRRLAMFRIVADAIRGTGVTMDDLKGRNRPPEVTAARQRIVKAARMAGLSLTEIGQYFDRHHTTILHWERAE